MATVSLKDRFAANTYVYVGRRTFRQRTDEVKWDKDEDRAANAPEQFPHTIINFSNVPAKDVAEHAGGKQGVVVDTQKAVDKATLNEVNAWRKAFGLDKIMEIANDVEGLDAATYSKIVRPVFTQVEDEGEEPEQAVDKEGNLIYEIDEPYVIIDFATSGTKLDVPKQPQDILDAIKEEAPELYEAALAPLSDEEQLEQAPVLYARLQSAMKRLG